MRRRRGISTKTLVALLSLVLLLGCSLGGTLAWLSDSTDPVINTFTVGDINISLDESNDLDLTIVPGVPIKKDPKVTVLEGSEACWLFVKVDEAYWPDFKDGDARKVDYAIADGWEELEGVTGVYYREVDAETAKAGHEYPVLEGNKVTVSDTLTKSELQQITTNPTLTFTAYAVQQEGVDTAAEAWKIANPATP